MKAQLTKLVICPVIIFHFFIQNVQGQSPSSPILLHSPFEPEISLSAGLQRGWGNGNISNLNNWGVFGIADFKRYKFQMAVGMTENENFENTFSFNSGISFSLASRRGLWTFQPAVFTGFGYTEIYFSTTENYEMINIPLGVSIGLKGPIPYVDVNISFAPKLQYRYINLNEGDQILGGGLNISFLLTPTGSCLGLRMGFDFLKIDDPTQVENELERSILLGLEYIFY